MMMKAKQEPETVSGISPFSVDGIFDVGHGGGEAEKNSSYGFLELLGFQDYSPSLLDLSPQMEPPLESSSVTVNTPATPNSSSISSSSTDADPLKPLATTAAAAEDEQEKTNKKL